MKTYPDIRRSFSPAFGGELFGTDTKEYLFGMIKRLVAEFKTRRPGVIVVDAGVGEPFVGPDPIIREAGAAAMRNPRFDGYPDLGLVHLREVMAKHFQDEFGLRIAPDIDAISLNGEDNLQDCHGIKAGLAALAMVFCAPGNIIDEKGRPAWPDPRIQVAVAKPGYGVFPDECTKLGAEVIPLPRTRENGYLPDLSALGRAKNLKVIELISPDNPTGAVCDKNPAFWPKLVKFCQERAIALIVDEAYAHLRWADEGKPFTALSVPGFTDVGVVLHSASKTFNCTAGRVGVVAGNGWIIKAYRKQYEDSTSGQTLAMQWAIAQAFSNFGLIVPEIRAEYRERMEDMLKVLQNKLFPAQMPGGSFFFYCPAPISGGGQQFANAKEFMMWLLSTYGIATVPFGDDHIRFSATIKTGGRDQPETWKQAIEMLYERIPNDLEFTA